VDPPVTAIGQPVQELGRRAVRALLERIEGRPVEPVVLDARLVVRRSCGEPGDERNGSEGSGRP
jgi:LacI family transcriptional regulator